MGSQTGDRDQDIDLLYAWRYLDDAYTENPDFILNHAPYRKASILISGDNFGAGSSREHAAWALSDYGFRVIIAGSFGDIHYNNDLNNGILPIVQPREVREKLAGLSPDQEVTVDLEQQKIISPVGTFDFDMEADWKHKLLNGLDDIGITLQYEDLTNMSKNALVTGSKGNN
ncbi:3-isopropylmalate dehydratase small subunit [Chlamydia trachomatis]|nr:3-isopropylmalate dehydratase small subunit [Chlamydia trachomatis]